MNYYERGCCSDCNEYTIVHKLSRRCSKCTKRLWDKFKQHLKTENLRESSCTVDKDKEPTR